MQRDDDSFSDRKKSQEAKYKMDEERSFKIRSRRNKLLGLWIARRLGLVGEAESAFARDVVMLGLDARTDEDLLIRLAEKLEENQGVADKGEMAAELSRCEQKAAQQISGEFPTALDGDHAPVGDSPHHRK